MVELTVQAPTKRSMNETNEVGPRTAIELVLLSGNASVTFNFCQQKTNLKRKQNGE